MIPQQLRLHNFLSYREAALSFEGIHVACLSGANGHGKSALLDAITWALWGRARARSDDEMIHRGETEMGVELEFRLGADRYRVVRQRAIGRTGRAGRSLLELHRWAESASGGEPGFVAMTGASLRETQAIIERLLRLDYDTFVNSAYLLQGRADAFTLKAPGERKEVLGRIIGLGLYDELEDDARSAARERQTETLALDHRLAALEAELAAEADYEAQVADGEAALAAQTARLASMQATASGLRDEQRELAASAVERRALDERLARDRDELARLEAQAAAAQAETDQARLRLARRDEIERAYAELVTARERDGALNDAAARLLGLRERQHQLELAIERQRSNIEAQLHSLQADLARLQAEAARRPDVQTRLDVAKTRLDQLDVAERELESKRERLEATIAARTDLVTARERLASERALATERLDLLAVEAAACPICGAPLDADHRLQLHADGAADIAAKTRALDECEQRLAATDADVTRLRREVDAAATALASDRATTMANIARLEETLEALQRIAAATEGATQTATVVKACLDGGDYAPEEQIALADVASRIDALGYDRVEHDAIRAATQRLQPYDDDFRRLADAGRVLEQAEASLAGLAAIIEERRRALEADEARRAQLAVALRRMPEIEARLGEVEMASAASSRQRDELATALGAARARLERCWQMRGEYDVAKASRARCAIERGAYDELALAFGKRGVQALLIERELPQIEADANALLARMTDGAMSLRLETQRQTAGGATIETLDIKIGDELGVRNYELYSGGEAFRINFALRVALSRLLARRAGASLPCLVIDEGFGTQDTAGRDRIVEAINAIKDDFELVLVITHIEELRDAFPVRIEVVKVDGVSSVAVVS